MNNLIKVAVLGSTGYTGLELVYILSNHPRISISFLGSESSSGKSINSFDERLKKKSLPILSSIDKINYSEIDIVFLALPHNVSQQLINDNIGKSRFIDLSADFRLDNSKIYKDNYGNEHICPKFLGEFIYGLPEINYSLIKHANNVAIPGCYPTSILLPLIPLFKDNLILGDNIIIDSKSGYSGAGRKFDITNVIKNKIMNFYNYNTNHHRHICEIQQELNKVTKLRIKFSFNPHILPIFRGMISTIYCDLDTNIKKDQIIECLNNFFSNKYFVKILKNEDKADLYAIQSTNYCLIKMFDHYDETKIILVSVIDNLLKGASGQAVQCMNIMCGIEENIGLDNLNCE